jgi:Tfp pilus assembly protein PilP
MIPYPRLALMVAVLACAPACSQEPEPSPAAQPAAARGQARGRAGRAAQAPAARGAETPATSPAPAGQAAPPASDAPTQPSPRGQGPAPAGQAATGQTPAPAAQPKPAAPAATPAPPPAAEPPTTEAPPPPATAEQAPAPAPLEPPGFTYNPEGRRDPFVTLLRRGTTTTRGAATGARPAGLAGLETAEVTLRGTVRSREGFVAILQGADQKTYIVRAGDKLFDGTVRTITQNDLVILQQVNDPLSLEKQREVRKVLRQVEAN